MQLVHPNSYALSESSCNPTAELLLQLDYVICVHICVVCYVSILFIYLAYNKTKRMYIRPYLYLTTVIVFANFGVGLGVSIIRGKQIRFAVT